MQQLIQDLIEQNRHNSERFCDAGVCLERERLFSQLQILAAAFKCMDGRINLPLLTRTPMGLIQPFRNIGGVFDLSWPALANRVVSLVQRAVQIGYTNPFFITYHYSEGEKHRGCLGMDYDTDRGIENAYRFLAQVERVFGTGRQQVYPLVVGIETDVQKLVFHNAKGDKKLDVGTIVDPGKESLVSLIREIYPDLGAKMTRYLRRMIFGNFGHIAEIAASPSASLESEHREDVLAFGYYFDWLHSRRAIVINPDHANPDEAVAKGAQIIDANRRAGRISSDKVLLFTSFGYDQPGYDYALAKEQAFFYKDMGVQAIDRLCPDMQGLFHTMVGVVYKPTRRLEVLEVNGKSS